MPSTERNPHHFIGAVVDEWQLYSDTAEDYTIGLPIGLGASSIVYRADFSPPDAAQSTPCALKVLDLDRLPQHSLRLLQRETQLMSLAKHPNVLRVRGTWMVGHKLYIALRLMNAGSAADVMHYGWPGGMEEQVVKCILKQALEGMNYLHINGFIHRDVKAANLLIDDDGTVLLGDLGVAAFLGDTEDTTSTTNRPSRSMRKRKSFVGTPCWMAPEVINGKQYDSSADIWSFGITALELAQGRPPRSREPSHAVLLHIVTNLPPTLDRNGGPHKYSRSFQEIIEKCLNKDPTQRPTAEELLQTPFFKSAKKKGYLVGTILQGLPPLTQRQERRKQLSVIAAKTMDSWDFSPTSIAASPTTSVYSHHKPRVSGKLPWEGMFDLPGVGENGSVKEHDDEEDGSMDADHIKEHRTAPQQHVPRNQSLSQGRSSLSHSRLVSWVDGDRSEDHADAAPEVAPAPLPAPANTGTAAVPPPVLAPVLETEFGSPEVSPSISGSSGYSTSSASAPSESSSASRSSQFSTPSGTLWRRLIGKADENSKEATSGDSGSRKKGLSGVFGSVRKRTAPDVVPQQQQGVL